ncbi:MAG: thioesterase family protein [Desulfarculales bacterium]|jgi:fluoroacetyl-CoA thioesterase|nr:thioesterase family protein [Desulfarculales bacterium]
MAELQVGLKHRESIKIDQSLLVPALPPIFSGMDDMPPVFATCYLVSFTEWTCIQALKPYYLPGQRSVGTYLSINHTAASTPGMTVTIEVELVELKGRLMQFKVTARDDKDIISEGTHGRALIDLAQFMAKVAEKAAGIQS